ncbi:Low density lipoprotein receptor adapter protein 1-B [Chionoecetes opilio]|uniref:Low density lipoprotein receptor adapter protein 1-B n=1 Tax=Chionoecetes opilio TaxID=41210 RepID=A0A8J5D1C1_CHIOP|nr:Low density lipoprotein receptor adapter protein 1-B [Chionoecetes opilio]
MGGARGKPPPLGASCHSVGHQIISYCSADAHYDHVFAFIATTDNDTCACHAFLCPKRKMAQAVTISIAQAFNLAYECWKMSIDNKDETFGHEELPAEVTLLVGGCVLGSVLVVPVAGHCLSLRAEGLLELWLSVHVTYTDDWACEAVVVLYSVQVQPLGDALGLAPTAALVRDAAYWWWFAQGLLLAALVRWLLNCGTQEDSLEGEEGCEEGPEAVVGTAALHSLGRVSQSQPSSQASSPIPIRSDFGSSELSTSGYQSSSQALLIDLEDSSEHPGTTSHPHAKTSAQGKPRNTLDDLEDISDGFSRFP